MLNAAKTKRAADDATIAQAQTLRKQGGPSQSKLGDAIARQQKAAMGLFGAKRKQEGRATPMSAKGIQAPVQIQSQKKTEAELKEAFDPSRVQAAVEGEERAYKQDLATADANTARIAKERAAKRAKVLQTIGKVGGGIAKATGAALTGGASAIIPGAVGKVLGKAGKTGAGRALSVATGATSPQQLQQQEFISMLQERARSGSPEEQQQAQQQLVEFYKA